MLTAVLFEGKSGEKDAEQDEEWNKCEDAFFSANERSEGEGKGKEEEGKGERERGIGSEALAETEKIENAPAGNRTRDPSKRS